MVNRKTQKRTKSRSKRGKKGGDSYWTTDGFNKDENENLFPVDQLDRRYNNNETPKEATAEARAESKANLEEADRYYKAKRQKEAEAEAKARIQETPTTSQVYVAPSTTQVKNTMMIESLRKMPKSYANEQEIKRLTQENQRIEEIRKQGELYPIQSESGADYEPKKYNVELKQPTKSTNIFSSLKNLTTRAREKFSFNNGARVAAGGGKRRTNKRRTHKRNTKKR
jgi:hypothetical protein